MNSMTPAVAATLCQRSNVGTPGVWRFQIRRGAVLCPDAGRPCSTGMMGACGEGRTACEGNGNPGHVSHGSISQPAAKVAPRARATGRSVTSSISRAARCATASTTTATGPSTTALCAPAGRAACAARASARASRATVARAIRACAASASRTAARRSSVRRDNDVARAAAWARATASCARWDRSAARAAASIRAWA
jgi:hypothetical protein